MGMIRPHLWYHREAHEAAQFYVSLFPNSSITSVTEAPSGVPDVPEGSPFLVEFVLDGMPVTAISAGPSLTLDEAFSFTVDVSTQAEVDRYWEALTADGGKPGPCGWCTDRFGLSWQIVPDRLDELTMGGDPASTRAREAMFAMSKIDIAAIEAAYRGE